MLCVSHGLSLHTQGDVRQLEHDDFFAPQARPAGQPLITVSNHVAAMDDPLLLAALTPLRSVFETGGMRWSLCATDRCFKNSLMSAFFRAGQVRAKQLGGRCLEDSSYYICEFFMAVTSNVQTAWRCLSCSCSS